jgi:hypothetical protein
MDNKTSEKYHGNRAKNPDRSCFLASNTRDHLIYHYKLNSVGTYTKESIRRFSKLAHSMDNKTSEKYHGNGAKNPDRSCFLASNARDQDIRTGN